MSRNRQRYNDYIQPYQQEVGDVNSIYQSNYDPEVDKMWLNVLANKQQRYDAARSTMAESVAKFGDTETVAPELLEERLSAYSGDMNKMVESEYGGDYGLALNDIKDSVAKEKTSRFYKGLGAQAQRAKEIQQLRLKDPSKFFLAGQGDAGYDEFSGSQINYRQQMEEFERTGDPRVFETAYGYDKDTGSVVSNLIKAVPSDVTQRLYTGLEKNDAEYIDNLYGEGASDKLTRSLRVKGNEDKIRNLKQNFVDIALEKSPELVLRYGEDEARNRISKMVDETMPLHFRYEESESAQNLGNLDKSVESRRETLFTDAVGGSGKGTSAVREAEKLINSTNVARKTGKSISDQLGTETFGAGKSAMDIASKGTKPEYTETEEEFKKRKQAQITKQNAQLQTWKESAVGLRGLKFAEGTSNNDKLLAYAELIDDNKNRQELMISPRQFDTPTKSYAGSINKILVPEGSEDGKTTNLLSLSSREKGTDKPVGISDLEDKSLKGFAFAGFDQNTGRLIYKRGDGDDLEVISGYPNEPSKRYGEALTVEMTKYNEEGVLMGKKSRSLKANQIAVKSYDPKYGLKGGKPGAIVDYVYTIPEDESYNDIRDEYETLSKKDASKVEINNFVEKLHLRLARDKKIRSNISEINETISNNFLAKSGLYVKTKKEK